MTNELKTLEVLLALDGGVLRARMNGWNGRARNRYCPYDSYISLHSELSSNRLFRCKNPGKFYSIPCEKHLDRYIKDDKWEEVTNEF